MPLDPSMLADLAGTSDDSKQPDPVQAAFDALRSAVDDAERQIMTGKTGSDEETPTEEASPDEEAD